MYARLILVLIVVVLSKQALAQKYHIAPRWPANPTSVEACDRVRGNFNGYIQGLEGSARDCNRYVEGTLPQRQWGPHSTSYRCPAGSALDHIFGGFIEHCEDQMIQICRAHTEKSQGYEACKRTAQINQANAKEQERVARENQQFARERAEQFARVQAELQTQQSQQARPYVLPRVTPATPNVDSQAPSKNEILLNSLGAAFGAVEDALRKQRESQQRVEAIRQQQLAEQAQRAREQQERERQRQLEEERRLAEQRRQQEAEEAEDTRWRQALDNPFASGGSTDEASPFDVASLEESKPQFEPDSQISPNNPFASPQLEQTAPQDPASLEPKESAALEVGPIEDEGAIDDLVRQIQAGLAQLEYSPGVPDGIFGTKTQRAILAFEQAEGVWGSGEPTPQLLDYIELALKRPQQCPDWLRYRDRNLRQQIDLLHNRLQVADDNLVHLSALRRDIENDKTWVSREVQIVAIGTAVVGGIANFVQNLAPANPRAKEIIDSSSELYALEKIGNINDFVQNGFWDAVGNWAKGKAADLNPVLRAAKTVDDAITDARQAYKLNQGFSEARGIAAQSVGTLEREIQKLQSQINQAGIENQAYQGAYDNITKQCGPIGPTLTRQGGNRPQPPQG